MTQTERLTAAADAMDEARGILHEVEAEPLVDRLTSILGASVLVAHAEWHLAEVRGDGALVRSMRALCATMTTACAAQWRDAIEGLDA